MAEVIRGPVGRKLFCPFNIFVRKETWENPILTGSEIPFFLSRSDDSLKNMLNSSYPVTRSVFEKQKYANILWKIKRKSVHGKFEEIYFIFKMECFFVSFALLEIWNICI